MQPKLYLVKYKTSRRTKIIYVTAFSQEEAESKAKDHIIRDTSFSVCEVSRANKVHIE